MINTTINNKVFSNEIEKQLLKTKPRFLHKTKMKEVLKELFKKRSDNLNSAKSYENESLKINFPLKKPQKSNYSLSNILYSYFY